MNVYDLDNGNSHQIGIVQVNITSFGYGHGPAPEATLTIDARAHFRNPHADPAMRDMTGLNSAVVWHVLDTPGVRSLVRNAALTVRDLVREVGDPTGRKIFVAVGCVGGRHRSVAVADALAASLRACGVGVDVEHRDVHKPVIQAN